MKRAKASDLADGAAKEEPEVKSKKRKEVVERISKFREFDLEELGLPKECWPLQGKEYAGRKGYTVCGSNNAAPGAKDFVKRKGSQGHQLIISNRV